jgi:lambda family phage portal protein
VKKPDKTYTKIFDEIANRQIEEAFYLWSDKRHCDLTGKMTFRQMCNVAIETVARDGEVIFKKIKDSGLNEAGFTLQIIPSDYLDHTYNEEGKNGSYIRMGIEYNKYGRPTAYHLTKVLPTSELYGITPTGERNRIPADQIIHLFYQEYPTQSRGFSWLTQSMWKLWQLGKFEEASVVNARVSAAKMGFFKDSNNDGIDNEFEEENGQLVDGVEPGLISYIGNKEFTSFDPKFPTDQYAGFTKSMLRAIASGLGVSYNTLCNDLEGVNYSSIRAGLLDEREFYKEVQGWFRDGFLVPVFEEWLQMWLLNPNTKLPAAKFDKFNQPKWIGRRWQWVDPLKDQQANKLAIEQGFKTRQQVFSEQGGDFLDTIEALKYEQDILIQYGINIGEPNGTETTPGIEPDPEAISEDGTAGNTE